MAPGATDIPDNGSEIERGRESEKQLDDLAAKVRALGESLKGLSSEQAKSIATAATVFEDASKKIQKYTEGVHNTKDGLSQLRKGNDEVASAMSRAFGNIGLTAALAKRISDARSAFEQLKNVVGSAVPFAAGKMQEAVVGAIDDVTHGLMTAQTEALHFEKMTEQSGMTFGKSFGESKLFLKSYQESYKRMIDVMKASPEDINKVRESFKDVMAPDEQIRALTSIKSAHSGFKGTVTASNAALAVAAAKGMDAGKAAQWMGKAITELGASTEQATLNFARIGFAAKGSGLSFEKVGDSIMSAADNLKMWGGTVSSVAPLFKSFSESLTGIGQKGLTPQLLQSFVQGLNSMQFGTKALLGMQMPGGAAKGAIGAGLEMEEALEKGPEGMKKVSESLVGMLKQFGGGKVVTRAQAIADPGLERNFMVQRQLLQTQMGLDQASATKTLQMLQNLDKNGMQASGDMTDELNTTLTDGQKTAEATRSAQEKAKAESMKAIVTSTGNIASSLSNLLKKVGGGKYLEGLSKSTTKLTSGQLKEGVEEATKPFKTKPAVLPKTRSTTPTIDALIQKSEVTQKTVTPALRQKAETGAISKKIEALNKQSAEVRHNVKVTQRPVVESPDTTQSQIHNILKAGEQVKTEQKMPVEQPKQETLVEKLERKKQDLLNKGRLDKEAYKRKLEYGQGGPGKTDMYFMQQAKEAETAARKQAMPEPQNRAPVNAAISATQNIKTQAAAATASNTQGVQKEFKEVVVTITPKMDAKSKSLSFDFDTAMKQTQRDATLYGQH